MEWSKPQEKAAVLSCLARPHLLLPFGRIRRLSPFALSLRAPLRPCGSFPCPSPSPLSVPWVDRGDSTAAPPSGGRATNRAGGGQHPRRAGTATGRGKRTDWWAREGGREPSMSPSDKGIGSGPRWARRKQAPFRYLLEEDQPTSPSHTRPAAHSLAARPDPRFHISRTTFIAELCFLMMAQGTIDSTRWIWND